MFKRNIELNFKRLNDAPYALENLFQSEDYDWPGDWEGRALLAFLCHYEINKQAVPHLFDFFEKIPEKINQYHYFGKPFDGIIADEQQLSGHNWYLRGLLKYYDIFSCDKASLVPAKKQHHIGNIQRITHSSCRVLSCVRTFIHRIICINPAR